MLAWIYDSDIDENVFKNLYYNIIGVCCFGAGNRYEYNENMAKYYPLEISRGFNNTIPTSCYDFIKDTPLELANLFVTFEASSTTPGRGGTYNGNSNYFEYMKNVVNLYSVSYKELCEKFTNGIEQERKQVFEKIKEFYLENRALIRGQIIGRENVDAFD